MAGETPRPLPGSARACCSLFAALRAFPLFFHTVILCLLLSRALRAFALLLSDLFEIRIRTSFWHPGEAAGLQGLASHYYRSISHQLQSLVSAQKSPIVGILLQRWAESALSPIETCFAWVLESLAAQEKMTGAA